MSVCDCSILFAFYNFGKVGYNWIGVCAVKLNLCSCHQDGKHCKHCNFTLLFCRGWQGLVHKCVPHVTVRAQVTHSTNQIVYFWRCRCLPRRRCLSSLKPGFHIVVSVVSVVSVVRKKFVRQTTLWKPPVQPLNTTETTDATCCT